MAAFKSAHQAADQLAQRDAPQLDRPEPPQQVAIDHLETLGDRQDLADPLLDRHGFRYLSLVGEAADRRDIRRDAEQTGTRLVVQLVGDLPPLILLHVDDVPVEAAILRPGFFQRFRQRVEARGDTCQLAHLRLGKARAEMSVLEFLHTAGKIEERVEQAAEDHIQKSQHHRRDAEPDDRAARHLFPHFAQLVARLADDDNAATALLAEHDAHLTRTDPRANEVGEPLRRAIGMHEDVAFSALVGRDLNEFAMRVADEDARVAHILQLLGHHLQKPRHSVGGGALDDVIDELLGEFHRRDDLDLDAAARIQHG